MVIGLQPFACFVHMGLCTCMETSAGFRQLGCPSVNVMEGLRNGRETYSDRQGSDPIRLR